MEKITRNFSNMSEIVTNFQSRLLKIRDDLAAYEQVLNEFRASSNEIKQFLPALSKELEGLEINIEFFDSKITTLRESIVTCNQPMIQYLQKVAASKVQLGELEGRQQTINQSRENYIGMRRQGENLLRHSDSIAMYHMARGSLEGGSGLDIVWRDSIPLATEQAYHLEKELTKIGDDIEKLFDNRDRLDGQIELTTSTIASEIDTLESARNSLKQNMDTVHVAIKELETLYQVAQEDTLHGAVMKGDKDRIKSLLFNQASLNLTDKRGHKPLYYACRGGHPDIAMVLVEYTDLNKKESAEILKSIPKNGRSLYSQIYSILTNKTTYDTLWDEAKTYSQNIKSVFEDYYSPAQLKGIPFLSDTIKRALTLNRDSKHVKQAEVLASFFNEFEEDLQNERLYFIKFINGKLIKYERENPSDSLNPYERRLSYIKNKLEAAELKDQYKHLVKESIFSINRERGEEGEQDVMMCTI